MQGLRMSALFIVPLLSINTVTDIKKRQVSLLSLLLFALFGALLRLLPGMGEGVAWESGWSTLGGVAVGLLLLWISFLSRGAIGGGDALCCSVLGLYLGFYKLLLLLLAGTLLAGMFGFTLMLMKKAGRRTQLPLMPFLLLAFLGFLAIDLVGGGG